MRVIMLYSVTFNGMDLVFKRSDEPELAVLVEREALASSLAHYAYVRPDGTVIRYEEIGHSELPADAPETRVAIRPEVWDNLRRQAAAWPSPLVAGGSA